MYRIAKISSNRQDKFAMPGTQSKITMHSKEKENMIHNEEKNQLMAIDPGLTHMIEL